MELIYIHKPNWCTITVYLRWLQNKAARVGGGGVLGMSRKSTEWIRWHGMMEGCSRCQSASHSFSHVVLRTVFPHQLCCFWFFFGCWIPLGFIFWNFAFCCHGWLRQGGLLSFLFLNILYIMFCVCFDLTQLTVGVL